MPPQSLLASTGFVVREPKSIIRGVAARACVLGPQLLEQTGGERGFQEPAECSALRSSDFDSVTATSAPYVEANGEYGQRPAKAENLFREGGNVWETPDNGIHSTWLGGRPCHEIS